MSDNAARQKSFEKLKNHLSKRFSIELLREKDRPIRKLLKQAKHTKKASKAYFDWLEPDVFLSAVECEHPESEAKKFHDQLLSLIDDPEPLLALSVIDRNFDMQDSYEDADNYLMSFKSLGLGENTIASNVDLEDVIEDPGDFERHVQNCAELFNLKLDLKLELEDTASWRLGADVGIGEMLILSLGNRSCILLQDLTGNADVWRAPQFEFCSLLNYVFPHSLVTFIARCAQGSQGAVIITTEIEKMTAINKSSKKKKAVKKVAKKKAAKKKTANPIDGMKFVITGKLPSMGRAEATEIIKDNGGKVAASISKNTDYLLCGEKTGTKLDKARALGVKVITEQKFLKMLPQ